MRKLFVYVFAGICLFVQACKAQDTEKQFSIDYEKITLSNGLDVVLYQDKSAPIVAVSVLYHVGSGREKQTLHIFLSI